MSGSIHRSPGRAARPAAGGGWLGALARAATRRPRTTIAAVLAVVVVAAAGMARLRLVTDGRALLREDATERGEDRAVRRAHELHDWILVAVEGDGPQSALHDQLLQALEGLAARVGREVEGVVETYALTDVTDVRWERGQLVARRVFEPRSGESPGERAKRLDRLAFFDGLLVTRDRQGACLFVGLAAHADRTRAYEGVTALAGRLPYRTFVAGAPAAEALMGRYVIEDLAWLVPLVVAVIGALLFLTLRSTAAVALTLANVVLALAATLGALGHLGVPFTLVASLLPVVLLTLGVADEIHVFAWLRAERARRPAAEAAELVLDALAALRGPIVFASLTTVAGFLAFAASPLPALRDFGLGAAAGMLVALVLTFSFLPAAYVVWQRRWPSPSPAPVGADTARRPSRSPVPTLVIVAILVLLSPLGWMRLSVQDRWIDNFDPASAVRVADQHVNQRFLSTHVLAVQLLDAETVLLPDQLQAIVALQRRLEAMPEVAGTRSIADLLALLRGARARDEAREPPLPTTLSEALVDLTQLRAALPARRLSGFLSVDRRSALVHVFLAGADYRRTRAVMAAVEDWRRSAPPRLDVRFAGDAYLSLLLVGDIVTGQLRSLILSMAGVLVLATVLLRSLPLGILASVPVGLAALGVFTLMGLCGLPLGVATSMFAALSVGVGVDYAIHWLVRFRSIRGEGVDPAAAAVRTSGEVGLPIAINALALMAGFAVLLASSVPPNRRLGALFVLSMLLCWQATARVLPALVALLGRRRS